MHVLQLWRDRLSVVLVLALLPRTTVSSRLLFELFRNLIFKHLNKLHFSNAHLSVFFSSLLCWHIVRSLVYC